MLIGEPPPTQADLHFRLFGIPIRVHPFFWIVSLLLVMGRGDKLDPADALIWVAVVFVSIVVHELGHAFTMRRYGGRPRITLYSLGGLASCDDCDRSPSRQIIISLAGPVAGFLLAGALLLATYLSGHAIFPVEKLDRASVEQWLRQYDGGVWFFKLGWKTFAFEGFASSIASRALQDLLFINIWWGLINLLPIYPLDGGRIARELFTLRHPRRGIIGSLWLSIAAAGLMAAYGLYLQSLFTMLMFGLLAYSNYQALQAYERGYY